MKKYVPSYMRSMFEKHDVSIVLVKNVQEKEMDDVKIEVRNIFLTGKLPDKFLPLNFNNLMKRLPCQIENEYKSPRLAFYFMKEGMNAKNHKKKASINLFRSGAMTISGVTQIAEAQAYINRILTMLEKEMEKQKK